MDFSVCTVAAFLALLLWVNSSTGHPGRAPPCTRPRHRAVHTVRIAGSRLPDCSHACGSCSPCRLVTVGSTCGRARPIEAESCPISYRCMCRNKLYPVP
ncbi:Epidermal patterning factor-like protein [Psidium guajava]|nr:Epidermal patterning factor-like protein [Psidium guajava]